MLISQTLKKIYETIKEHQIDLVVVGPEIPLVHGIVDFLEDKKDSSFWAK